jgi:hypothetical protein
MNTLQDNDLAVGFSSPPERTRAIYRRLMERDYPGVVALAQIALRADPNDRFAAIAGSAAMAFCECAAARLANEFPPLETIPAPTTDTSPAPAPESSIRVVSGAVFSAPVVETPADVVAEMGRCFLASDYPMALTLAELVLSEQPDHGLASALATECRALRKRGSSIPVCNSSVREVIEIIEEGDPRGTAVLRRVDGHSSVAEIARASELTPREALRVFDEFVATGVLRLDPPPTEDEPLSRSGT